MLEWREEEWKALVNKYVSIGTYPTRSLSLFPHNQISRRGALSKVLEEKKRSGSKLAKSEGACWRAAGADVGLLQRSTVVQVCWGRSESLGSLHPGATCARLSPFTALLRPRSAGSSPRTFLASKCSPPGLHTCPPSSTLAVSQKFPEGNSTPISFLVHLKSLLPLQDPTSVISKLWTQSKAEEGGE